MFTFSSDQTPRRRDVPVLGRRLRVGAVHARRSPPARWPPATRRAARSTSSRSARSAASRHSTASRSSTRRRRSYEWTVFPLPDPPAFDTVITLDAAGADRRRPGRDLRRSASRRSARRPTNLATFECSLDGEPFEECEPPLEYDGLAGRRHTLRVRAVDPALAARRDAGRRSRGRSRTRRRRRCSTAGLPPTETDSTTATFTFARRARPRRFECALDTTVVHAVHLGRRRTRTSRTASTSSRCGRRARPAASTRRRRSTRWTSGDMTPPVVTIDRRRRAASDRAARRRRSRSSSDDPDAQYLCTLTGAPDPVPVSHEQRFCSSPRDLRRTWRPACRTRSRSSRPSRSCSSTAEPAIWEWTITDTTAPETTIVSGPAAEHPARRARALHVLLQRAARDVRVRARRRRRRPTGRCDAIAAADFTGLEAGAHTLLVRAVDLADPPNVDATPASHTWTVIGPPTTTLLSAPAATTTERERDVHVRGRPGERHVRAARSTGSTSSRARRGVTLRRAWRPASTSSRSRRPTRSTWSRSPRSRTCGRSSTRRRRTTTIDARARRRHDAAATATFSFSSNEADASFECALDTPAGAEPAWSECARAARRTRPSSPTSPVGAHSLLVRAVDPSGNADASPAVLRLDDHAGRPAEHAGRHRRDRRRGRRRHDASTFGTVTRRRLHAGRARSWARRRCRPATSGRRAFYDVEHDARSTPASLSVCLTYDASSLPEPVRLLHFDGSVWIDVTTTNDRGAGRICGEPGSLGGVRDRDARRRPSCPRRRSSPARRPRPCRRTRSSSSRPSRCCRSRTSARSTAPTGARARRRSCSRACSRRRARAARARRQRARPLRRDAGPPQLDASCRSTRSSTPARTRRPRSTTATFAFSSDYPGASRSSACSTTRSRTSRATPTTTYTDLIAGRARAARARQGRRTATSTRRRPSGAGRSARSRTR